MTLDKVRTGTGRKLRTEGLTETALPIPYDAAAMPGATVLGTDGQVYTSAKDPAGIYRWAQGGLVDSSYGVRIFVEDNIRPELSGLVLGGRERPEGFPTGPARFVLTPLRDPTPAINGSLGSIDFASRAGISESAAEITTPCRIVGAPEHTLWGEGSRPTSLSISLLDANTTDRTARFRLQYDGSVLFSNALGSSMARFTAAGNLLIGNTTGTEKLDVTGNIKASGSLIGSTLSISGQSVRTTALQETALPIALDATTMPGAIVLGENGRAYAAIKSDTGLPYSWTRIVTEDKEGNIKSSDTFIGKRLQIGGNRDNFVIALNQGGIVYKPSLQVEGLTNEDSTVTITRTGATEDSVPRLIMARSRGTTLGSDVALQNGDGVAVVLFSASDGTSVIGGAGISAFVDGTPEVGVTPMSLWLRTRQVGDPNPRERMRITASGNVQINNTTGTERLSVTGNIQVTETSNGFRVGANQVLGSRKAGWAAPTGTATRTTFATSSVTTEQLAERVKALIDDLTSHGLIGT